MTISPINESQRKAAKVAGVTSLFIMVIVVFATFGIQQRLIVAGSAAETARNILAHERLFRTSIVLYITYCTGLVVLLTALYVILKPVSQGVALLASLFRLVYGLVWIMIAFNLFQALRILDGADYLRVFETDRLQALAKLSLGMNGDVYYVGLLFYALASTLCSYLWFKSHYVPRGLAVWGVMGSVFCVACTLIFIINPGFANVVNLWWFDTPMALFEVVLSVWLLVKGIRTPLGDSQPVAASAP